MRVHVHLLITTRLAATLFFAAGAAAAAGPNPAFTGFYSLSNVTELGRQVRLTISLDIVNRSGADVKNAAIWLERSPHPDKSTKTFTGISLQERQQIHLEDQITISSQEYFLWLHGSLPSFWIAYKNGKGQQRQHKIELAPLRGGTGVGI
jgi:hypothetical protein